MLSILGGTLWGAWKASLLVCFGSAIGATICNRLSYHLGRNIIRKYFARRMDIWNEQKHLFFYMLFLRVAPLLPNWFINLTSPHLGIEPKLFFWSTLIGTAPLSFIHARTGETIHLLTETGGEFTLFTFQNILTIGLIVIVILTPIIFRNSFDQIMKSVKKKVKIDDDLLFLNVIEEERGVHEQEVEIKLEVN
ncbi:385_t:CDS:2 [Diversispora eburnea]|uniref:385_t:CDS:1 n=1 Tax=Diversispora eburnea TaxID=1213867 RepID=A0A9N8YS72_9GLOM|nr:385_t:CDS:2 [Diversispora eburnea]